MHSGVRGKGSTSRLCNGGFGPCPSVGLSLATCSGKVDWQTPNRLSHCYWRLLVSVSIGVTALLSGSDSLYKFRSVGPSSVGPARSRSCTPAGAGQPA